MSENELNNIDSCDSLYKLLNECEIRIPVIQRDYAQGRDNGKAKEVRKRLLDDILHALNGNKEERLDFNFVYGNMSDDIFYPVDGQQRLTTLYLLHWFLACRAGNDYLNNFNRCNKFSYMTRNSAAEFFSLLKKPNNDLINLVKNSSRIKEEITDYAWFRAEWNNDPTVYSALNMLDAMSKKSEFKDKETAFYEKLINEDSPAIYFTVLKEGGNNAETAAAIKYIRMNARGKALTTFENVKAMLDGIDEKLSDKSTGIISDYDISFIDIFYNNTSDGNLNAKTEDIDNQTMCFFRNMYNVAVAVNAINKKSFDDDMEFANEMYSCSQRFVNKDKEFFVFYFNMMEAVLRVRKDNNDAEKFIDAVFNKYFSPQTNRRQVAYFIYLYYMYDKHINDKENQDDKYIKYQEKKDGYKPDTKKIKKFDYVLTNLMYDNWGNYDFGAIKKLAEQVSGDDDIFAYFSDISPDYIAEDSIKSNVSDIKQRIKEQHIKAKIIKHKEWKYNYFNKLEEQSERHKIQYLLWISDLWKDDNFDFSNIEVLEKYIKIASDYFMISNNELKWRKLFAIGGNWDKDNSKLLDSETINSNTTEKWETHSYWDNKKYFWDDDVEPDKEMQNILKLDEEKLKIVKRIYDLIIKNGEEKLFKEVKDNLDDTCWLKYAVLRNYDKLLKQNVKKDKISLLINVENKWGLRRKWRKFMPYLLLLDKEYSLEDDYYTYDFNSENALCGFGICNFEKTVKGKERLDAETKYTHTSRNDIWPHLDWRNYNINLIGNIKYNLDIPNVDKDEYNFNVLTSENTVYTVDKDKYNIYVYQEEKNDFGVYSFDMCLIKNYIKESANIVSTKLGKIHYDIKNGNFDDILEIKNDNHNYWKRMNANTHEWCHIVEKDDFLKKENDYKIMC